MSKFYIQDCVFIAAGWDLEDLSWFSLYSPGSDCQFTSDLRKIRNSRVAGGEGKSRILVGWKDQVDRVSSRHSNTHGQSHLNPLIRMVVDASNLSPCSHS